MVVGCLGDIVFQVSEETVETLQDVEWSGEARYTVHQRHLQNALTEFTGVEPDKISFSMQLTPLLGVDIIGELVKIWTYERSGAAGPLGVGEKPRGYDLVDWVLGHYNKEERAAMDAAVDKAVQAVELMLEHGAEAAMNEFNRKVQNNADSVRG